jgi:DNA-binding NtrC family response regulator
MSPHAPDVPAPTERRIAVVVRDAAVSREVERQCRQMGHRVVVLPDLTGLARLGPDLTPDLVLLDFAQLGAEPAAVLAPLTRGDDAPSVILVAAPSETGAAWNLLDRGAADVVHRPPHPQELRLRVARTLEARDLGMHLASLEEEITERSRRSFSDRILVARSEAMRALVETIGRVARMRTTVMVLGESGVGKELVARTIHFRSPRLDGPFIALNCAALPPHLIESELFGHERGAFTGAISRRAGKFELSHRGTLFLDEIGETDLPTQAKLLRVLEQQEFMRVGGSRPVRVDVRLVAATNADLERLVREGRFREDLYYRLKVVTLHVPPLRERREDIPDLAETFLIQVCRNNHLRPRRLTAEALAALCRYPWPGNVRELMNTLEALVVSSPAETLDAEHLPPPVQSGASASVARSRAVVGSSLKDVEAETIRQTLSAMQGSRTRTAEALGIGLRTLRRRIQELGLDRELPPRPGRPKRGPAA